MATKKRKTTTASKIVGMGKHRLTELTPGALDPTKYNPRVITKDTLIYSDKSNRKHYMAFVMPGKGRKK